MKLAKKFVMGALIVAPLIFVPATSRAGILQDILNLIKGDKKEKKDHKQGNSVPVDGGLMFLMAAGLGLGGKMIYDHNKKRKTVLSSI